MRRNGWLRMLKAFFTPAWRMPGRKGILLFLALFAAGGIFLAVEGWWHYSAHLEEWKARLQISARRHAELIQSVGRPDIGQEVGGEPLDLAALARKIEAVRRHFRGGEKEDLVLGRLEGQSIRFLLREGAFLSELPAIVPLQLDPAAPMRRALQGQSGTIFTHDHRGKTVLAAYGPVPGLGLGLVMHANLTAARWNYLLRQGLLRGLGILLAVGGIAIAVRMLVPPLPRREAHPAALASAQIIDQVREAVIVLDMEFRVVFWNKGAEAMYGYADGEMMGQTLERLFPDPECWNSFYRELDLNSLPAPEFYQGEVQRRRKSGEVFPIQLSLSLIRDVAGNPCGIIGTSSDISRRRQAEETLRKNQDLLRNVFDTIPHRLFVKDRQSNYLMVNRAFTSQFCTEPKDWVGRHTSDITEMPEDQRAQFLKNDRIVFDTGKCQGTLESRVDALNGETHYFNHTKTPLRDESGEIIGLVGLGVDVTGHVRAEAERRANQRLLQTVFDTIPQRIFVKDRDSRFLMVNRAWGEFYGIPPENCQEWHSDDLPQFNSQLIEQVRISDRLVLEEGRHIDEIQTWVPAEGQPLIHRIYKAPLRDENGKVEGIVGFAENITELKTTQRVLEENRNLLKTVFDSVPIGISVKDAQGRYRMANTIFGTLFGLHSPSILGKTFAQVNLGGDAESRRVEEADRELLETGKRVDRPQVRVEMPGGEEEWRRIIKTPLFDDSGANTGVVTVVVDITKEVDSEQALMDSWTTLQLAQEISRIGILDWNILTGDMKWSDDLYRIFGHSPQEIAPTFATYLRFAHPEDQSLIENALKQAVEDRKSYSFQHRFIRADQEVGTLQGQGRVFYDEQDRPVRMLGVIEDITDHVQALAQLQDYSARLLQSNRDLEDFATIASHDLQEPLRKINLFSDRLKLQDWHHLSGESRNYVNRIASTSERMRSLVQGLLTYSKISTNRNRFSVMDLGQILGEVVEELKSEIEESGARIHWSHLPEIEGDPRLIHQLFQNLIGNALKFRRQGARPVIEVFRAPMTLGPMEEGELGNGAEYCQINVRDSGIGFDSRNAGKIFKIFQRLHHPGEYQGVGIGLTLCRKIIDLHGGRIAAQGDPSRGAVFMCLLPTRHTSRPSPPGSLARA